MILVGSASSRSQRQLRRIRRSKCRARCWSRAGSQCRDQRSKWRTGRSRCRSPRPSQCRVSCRWHRQSRASALSRHRVLWSTSARRLCLVAIFGHTVLLEFSLQDISLARHPQMHVRCPQNTKSRAWHLSCPCLCRECVALRSNPVLVSHIHPGSNLRMDRLPFLIFYPNYIHHRQPQPT